MDSQTVFEHKTHAVDFCVVGGGLAGMCAAIAAARHGLSVALMHDRPVLGGNASSEIRMHVCGAHGDNNRETGIIEELELNNIRQNPYRNYSIWDSVLYQAVRFEDNITMLLNCSCCDLDMDGDTIRSVTGWQTTTQQWHTVTAKQFADCSGDSVLAPLSGAAFRLGREASDEFDEDIQPPEADRKTMGLSCLIQAREMNQPVDYTPPDWANVYETCADLPNRGHDVTSTNFWWIELGGENDSIADTEDIRDELLKIAFGVWDHIKNRCGNKDHAANWALDWVGFLPGKRESRRYVGDYIMTQNDVRAGGRFDDIIAYGGWSMDDHHPAGMRYPGVPTIFHPAPSPYGIPYRSLYSRNIDNLLFAGRNISVSHAALSSTRVMATCAVLGQAAGTAAALAVHHALSPRGVYEKKLPALQHMLMDDDCYLPGMTRAIPAVSKNASLTASTGDPEPLRNGIDRPVGGQDNGWFGKPESWVQYEFDAPETISEVRLVFDSDLNRKAKNAPSCYPLNAVRIAPPNTLARAFRIEVKTASGDWETASRHDDNHLRLVRIPLSVETTAIRFVPVSTWGAEDVHVFAFDVR